MLSSFVRISALTNCPFAGSGANIASKEQGGVKEGVPFLREGSEPADILFAGGGNFGAAKCGGGEPEDEAGGAT